MNTLSAAQTLAAGVWQSGLGQVIGGLVLVAVLIAAVWLGFRVRDRESRTPRPEEQPRRPDDAGIPGEASEYRSPNEVPRTDGAHRLMPYQLKDGGTTAPEPPSEEKRKWGGISSGGFGSGGTGHGD
ncbi:DUF6479 family protein [Streptomyces termitum]|uniref:DUF6479 family protein n=1 Tax=Streptomyces termitum TaxID=67368 RepID=UPI0033A34E73